MYIGRAGGGRVVRLNQLKRHTWRIHSFCFKKQQQQQNIHMQKKFFILYLASMHWNFCMIIQSTEKNKNEFDIMM